MAGGRRVPRTRGGGQGGDGRRRVRPWVPAHATGGADERAAATPGIATLVAARLGFGANQVTFTPVPPTERDESLTTGAVDMVVSTYMITEELKQPVGFAGPYLAGGLSLLVRRDQPTITGRDSLRGHKVCVARGTTSARSPSTM